jgi:hypothetical protein
MATKAQEAAERFWEITRHLSQGAAGEGSIFSIELDGDKLQVTFNEAAGVGRRFTFQATSNRKVKVDNAIVPAREVEGGDETVQQQADGEA